MPEERITYKSNSYYEIANPDPAGWRHHRDDEYREYRKKWQEYPDKRFAGDFPLHVDIDPTNACNLKCTMCPRTHYLEQGNTRWAPEGKIGFMSFDLYCRVIDQAADGGAYSVKLNFLGEPLLHPRIVDFVQYASQKGLEVMINTNAVLLTEERSARLLEAGLDDIFFSVDSPYAEVYERIRVGAKFHRVIDNIRRFIELKERLGKHHVQTRASMVLDPEDTDRKIREDYKKLFYGLGVAEIGFGLPSEMEVDYWKTHGKIDGFVCRDIYNRMFVYWDGLIGPCCGDWERGYILGDANEDRLKEVWQNDRYKKLREAHEENRYETIPICRVCSVPWLSTKEVAS
jgi:radical SAM protein with 4Fe4S-binding SPASM domain